MVAVCFEYGLEMCLGWFGDGLCAGMIFGGVLVCVFW